jgi:phosphate acetyltransferase
VLEVLHCYLPVGVFRFPLYANKKYILFSPLMDNQLDNHFIHHIKTDARKNPQRIVFPEANDDRVIQACAQINKEKTAIPVIIGNQDEVKSKAKELGCDLADVEIIEWSNFGKRDEYVEALYNLRKSKGWTKEKAQDVLNDYNYFGTMLVHMGYADGLISGTTHSTADTVRPALQIIGTKEAFHKVSGMFFMLLEERILFFGDCAINIDPDAKDLAEIAIDTALTAMEFGVKPKIAMLSFSTAGSARHPYVDKVKEATKLVAHKRPDLAIAGEMQVDAALVPSVCQKKFPQSKLKGDANVLIFPDLQSGNIAYKLVERLAKANAVGPLLQGLKKPVNDLSRGCSVGDIVDLAAITTIQAQEGIYENLLRGSK